MCFVMWHVCECGSHACISYTIRCVNRMIRQQVAGSQPLESPVDILMESSIVFLPFFLTREAEMADEIDGLRCPYCLEGFTKLENPKQLECGHIACLKCLDGHVQISSSGMQGITCTICGQVLDRFFTHNNDYMYYSTGRKNILNINFTEGLYNSTSKTNFTNI